MNKLKQLVLVAVASSAFIMMTGVAKADVNKVVSDITSAPAKLHNHIQMEIDKAKEYQKNSWADAKLQWLRLKSNFIKN